MHDTDGGDRPLSAADPSAIVDAVLGADRRVLLVGPPGIGKSTLVNRLAEAFGHANRACWCIGADPGSPLFGIPGAACLGRWERGGWALLSVEALCTLDAGRFRLPLVSAVARLAHRAPAGVVLVDGPGVVRGIAGAELLPGIAQAADVELVLALARAGSPQPLAQELAALPIPALAVHAASGAQRPGCVSLGQKAAPEGILLAEPGFRVRATTLEHRSPELAFAVEPALQLNVRKDRLLARGLPPGPWLGELKRCLQAEAYEAPIALPDGRVESVAALAADLVLIGPGKKLVYATDFSDSEANRRQLAALARGVHTLFCEAAFLEEDAGQAARTAHLTTRACGEIAAQAHVARLVPFHFSRRYEDKPERVYEEIAAVCTAVAIPKSMAVFRSRGQSR